MLGSGFDGVPLVVFEKCSDATVGDGFLGSRSDTASSRRQSRVALGFEIVRRSPLILSPWGTSE